MLNHPRFKPHLRVDVVPGEGAFVLTGTSQTLLRGQLYERVVPWIGNGRTPDDLCAQLEDQVAPAEVYFVLNQLERKGYLCEEDETFPVGEASLWSAQRIDPSVAARRLAESAVSVVAFGIDEAPFLTLLDALRVRVAENAPLGVVLADDYLRADLKDYNAKALRNGQPWLLFRPVGTQIWSGPLFRPGVTGCWECLAHRLRANHPVASYLAEKRGGSEPAADVASSPATRQLALGLAAHAVATWIGRGELPDLEGKIQSYDVTAWKTQAHVTVRLPYCPACGTPEAGLGRPVRPIELADHGKTLARDGGHRVVAPEATLEKYGHHVSPLTGAVTMLERVGTTDGGIMHVYIAGHNLARRHHSLEHLRGDLRSMASGKGATDVQARASGLCEGLERFSGVFRGDEPRRLARGDALGDAAVDVRGCLLFSDRQYREREVWNARKSSFHFVPHPYDPEAEIEWTPAWSLTRREGRFLPTGFCYFNYHHPQGKAFCVADSNGNAAGNTVEEAILQGFLELVERDSVALWWYNRVRRPEVDLNAFAEPYYDRLRDHLRGQGRDLWALDLTSDLGVPVFAALTRDTTGPEERIVLGFGAHLEAPVALMRAVTEMNQMLAHLPPPGPSPGGSVGSVTDAETLEWLRTATLANQPYLVPDASTPPRIASAYPQSWSEDVAENVRACQALVEGRGMEMLVLDQTRSEIGLPVVKVIVPGLRHFWARFAPGRLYEVPARLGWLPQPLSEEELNPIPMFL